MTALFLPPLTTADDETIVAPVSALNRAVFEVIADSTLRERWIQRVGQFSARVLGFFFSNLSTSIRQIDALLVAWKRCQVCSVEFDPRGTCLSTRRSVGHAAGYGKKEKPSHGRHSPCAHRLTLLIGRTRGFRPSTSLERRRMWLVKR